MKIKIVYISLLVCFTCSFAGTGSAGAQFLQIGGGTKAIGMGSAYVAYAQNCDAIYWNPAGLAFLNNKKNFSVTHLNYFAEMNYENIAFTIPLLNGTMGVSLVGLLSGDIEVTTVDQQEGTGENYSSNDFAVGLSYSTHLTDKFSIGATFKIIQLELAELSAQGWAFDMGAIYNTGIMNNLRIGFVITNFGPDMRYKGDDLIFKTKVYKDRDSQEEDARGQYLTELFQLPLKLQIGIAIDVINADGHKLVATLDGINPNDYNETFGIGLEYSINRKYFLRMGYTSLFEKSISAGASASVGNFADFNILINYGFEVHNYLGDLHRIGTDIIF